MDTRGRIEDRGREGGKWKGGGGEEKTPPMNRLLRLKRRKEEMERGKGGERRGRTRANEGETRKDERRERGRDLAPCQSPIANRPPSRETRDGRMERREKGGDGMRERGGEKGKARERALAPEMTSQAAVNSDGRRREWVEGREGGGLEYGLLFHPIDFSS